MFNIKTFSKRKLFFVLLAVVVAVVFLGGRLSYLMISKSHYYTEVAQDLHERERGIKAARGIMYDRNGIPIAVNKQVSTISVIHSQIKEAEKVARTISDLLGLDYEIVLKKVNKNTSIEKIKSNVDKETADKIRSYKLDGVKVDEDYLRYYPYDTLASKVIGFTGSDNQGIVGLEAKYDEYLKGKPGKILTLTNARGVDIKDAAETRQEPINGNDLTVSIDVNIQMYAEQICENVLREKQAKSVSMIVMNPQNGEIYSMVNFPEYNLNEPFTLNIDDSKLNSKQKQDALNKMWRNACINDTYEPGSTFKIFTATAGLAEKVVSESDHFNCPGFKIVEDRKIRCHKTTGHGSENFVEGVQNSCNPIFMETAARLGTDKFYEYFTKLGFMKKTGIDLSGEAGTIIHKKKNVGAVELATMSFGQSFQITPLQLIKVVSTIVNGGKDITPHFALNVSKDNEIIKEFEFEHTEQIISKELSIQVRNILESVVSEGTGHKSYIEGYKIGGKTATSEKLPRGNGKYIASFIGFAPADNPQVIALVLIDEPQGLYYGGTIAAPVVKKLFENVLPYLKIENQEKE